MSIENTLEERSRYGEFSEHAKLCQALKNMANNHRLAVGLFPLLDFQQEGIDMIFHKIARIMNGDSMYIDNWHDLQGYAKLVEDLLIKGQGQGAAQRLSDIEAPVPPMPPMRTSK